MKHTTSNISIFSQQKIRCVDFSEGLFDPGKSLITWKLSKTRGYMKTQHCRLLLLLLSFKKENLL
jgi:hypothetical protein